MRKAIATLDEAMDEHLAFARKSTVREYAESIGVAVAIALLLRAFVVEAFQIPSGSMIPTLEVGDHIFVSKFSYGLSHPLHRQEDLAVRHSRSAATSSSSSTRSDHSTDYIKRVVGLPGDTVEVQAGGSSTSTGSEVHRERHPDALQLQRASRTARRPDDHDCEPGSRRSRQRSTTRSSSRPAAPNDSTRERSSRPTTCS